MKQKDQRAWLEISASHRGERLPVGSRETFLSVFTLRVCSFKCHSQEVGS